ncbi:MAG: hypothetical protein AAGA64_16630 [Bacteroidota bacterium]
MIIKAKVIKDRLKSVMEMRGNPSMASICKKMNISEGTLKQQFYNEDSYPKTDTILKFAKVMRVSAAYLLGETDMPNNEDEELVLHFHMDYELATKAFEVLDYVKEQVYPNTERTPEQKAKVFIFVYKILERKSIKKEPTEVDTDGVISFIETT